MHAQHSNSWMSQPLLGETIAAYRRYVPQSTWDVAKSKGLKSGMRILMRPSVMLGEVDSFERSS